MTDAERCRKNGWTVGTRLIGTERHGTKYEETTTIEITAIGRDKILAITVASTRYAVSPYESVWTLEHRNWREA